MTRKAILVGHPSYDAPNNPAIFISKSDAITELRNRGAKRDDARHAVNSAADGSHALVGGIEVSPADIGVVRIVSGSERFYDVFMEAIAHGAFVFSNGRRAVIARIAPTGFHKLDHSIAINSRG